MTKITKTFILFFLLVILTGTTAFARQDQRIEQKLAALEKIRGRFSFIVLGDNRTGDDIYKKLVGMVMERSPDFVVNTGDMITNPGDLEQWARFWSMSKPVTVPYFLTVGNHDVSRNARSSEKTYKEQVDLPGHELYYTFVAGNSLFVILDSQLDGQEKRITGEQFTWLETILTASNQRHKFVFVHHPLYPEPGKGRHHGNSLDRYKQARDRLQALFKEHKVTAVFNGHEHLYFKKVVDGVTHVITGGGGAPLYAEEQAGGFYHFIRVIVDGDKVNGEVVNINGKVRDKF